MSAHIAHPQSHTHGLCDDCPECQKRIESPLQLDPQNLRRIWAGQHHTRTDVKVYDTLYRGVQISSALTNALNLEQPHYTDPASLWFYGGKA